MPTSTLPSNPSVEHLRKDAKRLRRAVQARDADALVRVNEFHPRARQVLPRVTLADAQLVTARSYGFTSWMQLMRHLVEIRPFVRTVMRWRGYFWMLVPIPTTDKPCTTATSRTTTTI